MSGDDDDDEEDHIAPSFEEQIRFLRKARKIGTTRFQKTTEFNVSRKLRRELREPEFDQLTVDNRLEAALNRETHQDIFGDSLSGAVLGKRTPSNAPPVNDGLTVGKAAPPKSDAEERTNRPQGSAGEEKGEREGEEKGEGGAEAQPGEAQPGGIQAGTPEEPTYAAQENASEAWTEQTQTESSEQWSEEFHSGALEQRDDEAHSGTSEQWSEEAQLGASEQWSAEDQHGASEQWSAEDQHGASEQWSAEDQHGASEQWSAEDQHGASEQWSAEDQHGASEQWSAEGQHESSQHWMDEAQTASENSSSHGVEPIRFEFPEERQQLIQQPAPSVHIEPGKESSSHVPIFVPQFAPSSKPVNQPHLGDAESRALASHGPGLKNVAAPSQKPAATPAQNAAAAPQKPAVVPAQNATAPLPSQTIPATPSPAAEIPSSGAIATPVPLHSDSVAVAAYSSVNKSALGLKEGMSREQSERQLEFSSNYIFLAIQFKEETGLDLVLDDKNTINLVLNASGESLRVYAVDFSDSGMEEAKVFANTLIEQYVNVLSTDFGLEFGRAGEVAVRQLELISETQLGPGKALLARKPRIDELKALHRAIEYSWPATFQLDDQLPMRIVFLSDLLIEGDDSGVLLKFMEDGRPILFISPALCQRGRPTEADPVGADEFESWQASIMREFAWKSAVDCNKFPLSADEFAGLGWVSVTSASENGNFALKTARGILFRPYDQALTVEQAWARCNERGDLVNQKGSPITNASEIVFLSIDDMAQQAAVRPVGEHFFNAEEEIVDALRSFRQGADFRAYLGTVSPRLYQIVKALDQAVINRCYAPTKTYAGLIRSVRGSLQDNNPNNQKELLLFEQKLSKLL